MIPNTIIWVISIWRIAEPTEDEREQMNTEEKKKRKNAAHACVWVDILCRGFFFSYYTEINAHHTTQGYACIIMDTDTHKDTQSAQSP